MQQNIAADAGLPPVSRLAEFRYGNEVITNALIRLKGWSSWRQAVHDDPPKLQFVIAFNEVDDNGRFHGLRKIELDMPRIDQTYLRQRVSLAYLRALGLPAQCANNARLFINGAFYGLYTNLERPDKDVPPAPVPGRGPRRPLGRRLAAGRPTRTRWRCRTRGWTRSGRRKRRGGDRGDRRHGRGAARMGGRGDARRRRRLLARPLELLHLRSPDARLAVDPPRPRRRHQLARSADRSASTTGAATPTWAPPWQHYAAVIKDAAWRERYVAALAPRQRRLGRPRSFPRCSIASRRRSATPPRPIRPARSPSTSTCRRSRTCGSRSPRASTACAPGSTAGRRPPARSTPTATGGRSAWTAGTTTRATYPGAAEICGDGRDQDCDGFDRKICM